MPRAGGVGVSCIVNSNQTFHQSFSPVHFNASWQVLSHHVGGLWSISISQSSPVLIEELIQMFSPPPQQLVLSIIKSGNWKKWDWNLIPPLCSCSALTRHSDPQKVEIITFTVTIFALWFALQTGNSPRSDWGQRKETKSLRIRLLAPEVCGWCFIKILL